jgi:hypothetical protein
VVHLVQVDPVGLQPAQRLVTGLDDVARGQALVVGALAHPAVHLRRDHHRFAPTPALREPPPDDLLGDAFAELPAVHVGRVVELDAEVERAIHDLEAVRLGGLRAEVHRAETQARDAQPGAAEVCVLHDPTLIRSRPSGRADKTGPYVRPDQSA